MSPLINQRPLVIGNAGNFSSNLTALKDEVISVYLDISKQSLPPPGTHDYSFGLGLGGGTGENVFSSFIDLSSEKFRITQMLNLLAKNHSEEITITLILSGCCPPSSSSAISPSVLYATHQHPYFRNKLKIALVTTELSKITSGERAYNALTNLLIIHDLADIVLLADNDTLGYPTRDLNLNPYQPVDEYITQALSDLFAQDRTPRSSVSLKDRIWSSYRFQDEFKTPEWQGHQADEIISGKALDLSTDLPALIPDKSNKWACFSAIHPKTKVTNAFDLVERCLTTLSTPVGLPLYGQTGAAVLLHKVPFFQDLNSALKQRFASELLSRPFVFNPEKHGNCGILFLGLGMHWTNFPVLTTLLEKAVIYAEEKAGDKIPDLLREAEKKISQEKHDERKKLHADAFARQANRILSKTARKRKEESENYLLDTLDEDIRQSIEQLLTNKTGNDLSQVFEKKTGAPNPFWIILQEAYEL